MKRYMQFTSEQRYQISGLKKAGLLQSPSQIADLTGVQTEQTGCATDN